MAATRRKIVCPILRAKNGHTFEGVEYTIFTLWSQACLCIQGYGLVLS